MLHKCYAASFLKQRMDLWVVWWFILKAKSKPCWLQTAGTRFRNISAHERRHKNLDGDTPVYDILIPTRNNCCVIDFAPNYCSLNTRFSVQVSVYNIYLSSWVVLEFIFSIHIRLASKTETQSVREALVNLLNVERVETRHSYSWLCCLDCRSLRFSRNCFKFACKERNIQERT